MRIGERRRDIAENRKRVLDRQRSITIDTIAQRFTIDKRHDIIGNPCPTVPFSHGATIKEWQYVGVLQIRRDFDFLEETLGPDHHRKVGM